MTCMYACSCSGSYVQVDSPKREDVECLCKLMATVGGQLDSGSQKGHELMDAYFHRVGRLANSDKLESRLRFMLRVRLHCLCALHGMFLAACLPTSSELPGKGR